MSRQMSLVTYTIRRTTALIFLTPDAHPVAPNSEYVAGLADDAPVIRITGQIVKVDEKGKLKAFTSRSLTLDAEKYRHPAFSSKRVGTTYTLVVPQFQRGPGESGGIDSSDETVAAFDSFFAPAAE